MSSAAGIVLRSVGIRADSNSPMHVCFNPAHRVSEPEMLPFSLVVEMRQETRQISRLVSIGGSTLYGADTQAPVAFKVIITVVDKFKSLLQHQDKPAGAGAVAEFQLATMSE